ncbi:MAG: universal stress protein [Chloroflexi bacterium]|nr:universal stress protein [Chloroflexota bacterium]
MIDNKRAVLFCLSGLDTKQFIERAAPHVPVDRPLILLYVIDTRPSEELGYIARRLHSGARVMADREALIASADEQTAEAVLAEAESSCVQLGFSRQAITTEVKRGRPEQEIVYLAAQPELQIGLVVIGSSYKRGPRPPIGPASVGHVARFAVDHSPCDVLMLR